MPIYEYRCPSCGAEFEKLVKMNAPAPPCPECGETDVNKRVSASAFVLKGSGWYKDHYGLKSSASSSSESGASSTASSPSKSSESAPKAPSSSSSNGD